MKTLNQDTASTEIGKLNNNTISFKQKTVTVDYVDLMNNINSSDEKSVSAVNDDSSSQDSMNETDSSPNQKSSSVDIFECTDIPEPVTQKVTPINIVELTNKAIWMNVVESLNNNDSSKQTTIWMDVAESLNSNESTQKKVAPVDVVPPAKDTVAPRRKSIPLGWKTDVAESSNKKIDSPKLKPIPLGWKTDVAPVQIVESTTNNKPSNTETVLINVVETITDSDILDLNVSGIGELTNSINEYSHEETISMDDVEFISVTNSSNDIKTAVEVVDLTSPATRVTDVKRECCTPKAATPKSSLAKVKSVKKESMPSTPVARPGKRKAFETPKSGYKAKKKIRSDLASTSRCPLPDPTYTEIGDVSTNETFVSVRGKVIYNSRIHQKQGIELYFDVADETGIIRVFGSNKVAFAAKKQIIIGNTIRLVHVKVEQRKHGVNNLDHRCELHLNENTDIIWEIKSRLKNEMSLKVKFIPYNDVGKYGREEYFDLTGKIVDFSAASSDGRRSITISDGRRYDLKVCFCNWYIPVHETMIGLPIDILRCYYNIVNETVEATGAHVKIDGRPVVAYHHTYLDFF